MTDTTLPDPPYPPETIARGWRFEIDMETFKRSDTWKLAKTGAVRGALLLLWAEAWQEKPCGTLPDDDELIALMIDMPAAVYAKHRSVMRRGWKRANDGRLYHETITNRVLAMLDKRATDAERSAARRLRNAEAAAKPEGVTDASRVTHAGVGYESDTKHQAPSTKEENPPTPRKRGRVEAFPPGFEAFWSAYPRKVAKDSAAKAFARLKPDEPLLRRMLDAIERQKASPQWAKDSGAFIPHPTTWLNGRRWEDEATLVASTKAWEGAA